MRANTCRLSALGAAVVSALSLTWGTAVAEAQSLAPNGPPAFGRSTLRSGFLPDPTIVSGMAGGPVSAQSASSNCRGWVTPQPTYVLGAASGFGQLSVVVSSNIDTTLLVMLPDGQIVCDDDGGEGANPLVRFSTPPGPIRVWIGTYSQGVSGAFTMGFTEYPNIGASNLGGGGIAPPPIVAPPPGGGINPSMPPSFGTVQLRSGFMPDPRVVSGNAGGPIAASQVDPSCRGYLSPQPSHVLFAQSGFSNLRILVHSSADTTLFVQLPSGQVLCDDDGGEGLDPAVAFPTSPGAIRIWVGVYSGAQVGGAPYQLGFTEFPHVLSSNLTGPVVVTPPPPPPGGQLAGLNPSLPPSFGMVSLRAGFLPDPQIAQGMASGSINASGLGGTCRGWAETAPSHVVMAQSSFSNLRFVVSSDIDTTLIVQLPNGQVLCDDDGGGSLNPLVQTSSTPGPIRVWVGVYGSGARGAYTIGFTELSSVSFATLRGGPGPGPGPGPRIPIEPPPIVSTLVQMMTGIPVTLFGPGMTDSTTAVWQPRGGPEVRLSMGPGGQILAGSARVVTIPADALRDSVVTLTQLRDSAVLLRAERPPSPGDQGQQTMVLLRWSGGGAQVAEQWSGSFRDRAPRWTRQR